MKGGIAAVLIALEAIRDAGIDLGGDLIFQSTIEEEAGGVGGTLSVLDRGYVPDAAIIAEPSGVPNVTVASAGVMYFRIRVPGKSTHAATGHEGVNAIGKAVALYEALADLDAERKARIDYSPAYRENPSLEGNVTNLNVGTIEAGHWPSTVPSEAVLEGRIGWPPGETCAEVRAEIERTVDAVARDDEWLAEHPPEVEWFGWQAAPHETPTDAAIVEIATAAGEAVTGDAAALVGRTPGSTSDSSSATTTRPRSLSAPSAAISTARTNTRPSRRCAKRARRSPAVSSTISEPNERAIATGSGTRST